MGRTKQTARTGKRSKKAKEWRKLKADKGNNLESTDDVIKSPANVDTESTGESGEMKSEALKQVIKQGETGGVLKGSDEERIVAEEMEGQGQSDEKTEGDGLLSEGRDEEEKEAGEGEGDEEMEEEGEGESDDDAPEDITLAEGKSKALEQQKDEGEEIKRVKATAKQKRTKRHELFKKQKETKELRKIAKFPEEGLEIVTQKMAEEKALKKAEEKRKKRQAEAAEATQVAPEPSAVEVRGVKIVSLGEEDSEGQSVLLGTAAGFKEASNFLKQSLYGGRQKRIPVLSLQAKRYRNQPAKNFTVASST